MRANEEAGIWVSLPYATFLLLVRDGRITEAPPAAGWTRGRAARQVVRYYERKGARIVRI